MRYVCWETRPSMPYACKNTKENKEVPFEVFKLAMSSLINIGDNRCKCVSCRRDFKVLLNTVTVMCHLHL